MTEAEAVERSLARAAQIEADQRRQILTDLLLTASEDELDIDAVDEALDDLADRWAAWRQALAEQVRADVRAVLRSNPHAHP